MSDDAFSFQAAAVGLPGVGDPKGKKIGSLMGMGGSNNDPPNWPLLDPTAAQSEWKQRAIDANKLSFLRNILSGDGTNVTSQESPYAQVGTSTSVMGG